MKTRTLMFAAGAAVSLAHFAHTVHAADAAAPVPQVLGAGQVDTPNGRVFTVTKSMVGDREVLTYRSEGLELDRAGFEAWCNANPAPKIDAALSDLTRRGVAGQVPVVITLADNPYEAVRQAVEAEHAPRQAALDARRAELQAKDFTPDLSNPAARESWLRSMNLLAEPGQDPFADERAKIKQEAEAISASIREETLARVVPQIVAAQERLEAQVQAMGGTVRGRLTGNAGLSVYLPAAAVNALAADPAVAQISLNAAGQGELAQQAISLGLTTGFWANGIDGGIWDGAQLDSGIDQNHPTFAGKTFLNALGMGTEDSDGHGTAVASIMVGGDATNRGMAFGVDTYLNTSWNDVAVSLDWMFVTATSDPEVVNGSFGIPADAPSVADYTATETRIDYTIRTQSALYTKSAGNLGSAAETLTQPAGIYNGLVVANMEDFDDTNRANDRITASSSRGPTIAGRKKPDIAAPGTGTFAANNNWDTVGVVDWADFGGTSSAAPHVAGGVLLLTDARSSDAPLPIKAILINSADTWTDGGTLNTTADDGAFVGSQWNQTYGWGYLDLGAAYTNRTNVISSTLAETPDHKFYKGTMPANSKATLVWNRFVTLNAGVYTAQTLTDMDLFCYRQSNGTTIDASAFTIDNVEQVFSSASQAAVLKVDLFGSIDNDIGATDAFALAHPGGFVPAIGPEFTVTRLPTIVSPGEPTLLRLTVRNTGDLNAHDVDVTITGVPAGWTLSATGPINVPFIGEGDATVVEIGTLTPPCNLAGTVGTFDFTVRSDSYGEILTTASSFTITVAPIEAIADNASVTFSAPRTYSFATDAVDFHAVGAFAFPASNNVNVLGDNDPCITSPWQNSNFLSVTDFVIVGPSVGGTVQYAHIADAGDITPLCVAKHDDGQDISLGNFGYTFDMAADEPIQVIEASLTAGKLYRVQAQVNSGTTDIAVLGYNPDAGFEERNSADFSRDAAGAGGSEVLNRRATLSGSHAFVVANDNKQASNITVRVRCAADHNGVGNLSVQDIFDFLTDWFNGSAAADFNLSGGAPTVQDIFDFLTEWFAGC